MFNQRYPAGILMAALLLAAQPGRADLNTDRFLTNPDFTQGGAAPDGWEIKPADPALAIARDTAVFRTAPAALRIDARAAKSGDVGQLWKAVPKGAFTLTGWAKVQGAPAQVVIQGLGADWSGQDWDVAADLRPGPEWQPFTAKIDLGPKASHAYLHVVARGTGTVWIDDLRLQTADGADANPALDVRPIPAVRVRLTGTTAARWGQVAIGSGGTCTQIVAGPPGTRALYVGADVAGPFRRDFAQGRWEPLVYGFGPKDACRYNTECIAVDPTDPKVVYYSSGKEWVAGTPDILRSADGGRTWTPTGLRRPDGKPVFMTNGMTGLRIAIDPADSRRIVYASRKDGLFRTDDGAKTWRPVTGFPGTGGLRYALWDRTDLFVRADDALYRSHDGGKTWAKAPDGPKKDYYGKLARDGSLVVSGDDGVFRFGNGAWADISPVPGGKFFDLAVSPADPNLICTTEARCGDGGHFYRTLDGGKSWTTFADADFGRGRMTSVVDRVQPWQGEKGITWHAWSCAGSLTFDPVSPRKLWLTDWPGIASCADVTAAVPHWRCEYDGHEETCVNVLITPPKGAPLLDGQWDNGGFRHPDIARIPEINGTRGIAQPYNDRLEDTTDMDFCEADPDFTALVGTWNYSNTGQGGVSTDNGVTWRNFGSKPFADAKGGRLAVMANDPAHLVWGPMGETQPLYFTRDGGKTWAAAQGAPSGMMFGGGIYFWYRPLASDRVRPETVYAYDRRDGRVYRSADGGAVWKHVATLPAQSGDFWVRHTLAAAPGRGGEVWAALDDRGLFRSSDGGATWTRLAGVTKAWLFGWGRPDPGSQTPVAYLMGRIDGDQTAKEVCVYRSLDLGKSWTRVEDGGSGWALATQIVGDRQTPDRLYIATDGQGIFTADAR